MMCPLLCRGLREMEEEGWGMGDRVQLIAWWWNFSVSFIIKQLLSVIDLRRGVSESCGIREPNCAEGMHYSTGILTPRLARACQILSGGLGVATTLYPSCANLCLISHSHRGIQIPYVGALTYKLHAHGHTFFFDCRVVVWLSDRPHTPLRG